VYFMDASQEVVTGKMYSLLCQMHQWPINRTRNVQ
jgi:hypothetical protein